MSFGKDISQFREKLLKKYVKVKRIAAFDLFSSIVLETPVDKGVLRNNWFAEIGTFGNDTLEDGDKSGSSTINRIRNVLEGTSVSDDIFFSNNLPYSVPIEFDGISGKAPQGMVRINTARWEQIVKAVVRKVGRGG